MTQRPAPRRPPRRMTVAGREWLTPRLVRVRFTGPDVASLPDLPFTDSSLKLIFPPADAPYRAPFHADEIRASHPPEHWPVTRTYTIRGVDRRLAEVVIDVVVHGEEGLAGPWAARVEPGESIDCYGPRGTYAPDPDAGSHLLVGDEAALPAVAAALERLPPDARADVFLEVVDTDHQLPLSLTERTRLTWVHRHDRPYGEALAAAVRRDWVPTGDVQAFVHGNAEFVGDLRRFLFVERELDRQRVSISGYWRTGYTEDRWLAAKAEFNAALAAAERALAQ